MKAIIAAVAVAILGAEIAHSRPQTAQRVVVPPSRPGIVVNPAPDLAFAHRRWVAVTHTWDYLQQFHLSGDEWALWLTRTSLFGINGTDRTADIGVYVFGQGQQFLNVFHQLQPGLEHRLLPGDRVFGPGPVLGPNADDHPPEYRGETIVVVSSEPMIVTGAVIRGFNYDTLGNPDTERFVTKTQSSRTLDVRQFDCSVPAEFAKVSHFCRNLSPRPRE